MSGLLWHRDRGLGLTVLLCGLLGLTSCTKAPATAGCVPDAVATPPATALARSPDRWQNVQIAGMGFVTGVAIHPTQKDLIYVRTDVGGIYRLQHSRWVQLLDGMPGHYSIESMALDAQNPAVIYAATGAYTPAVDGEIIKSMDGGKTWVETNLRTPSGQRVRTGGNEDWRWAGERLAVDPNQSQIVYFGSRLDGLYRSRDGAKTWQLVRNFPTKGRQGGMAFVVFDPRSGGGQGNRPSQVIYVGVMGSGVYRSGDGGKTWNLLTGGPDASQNPQQAAIAPDGTLYVSTFTTQANPQGGVWQYRENQWTPITPASGKNYSAIAVDAQTPQTVMAATYPLTPKGLYRSTDGGATWQPQRLEVDAVGWWPQWHLYTLSGGLALNPHRPQQAWLTTGFGVMRTEDVTRQPSRWCAEMSNLEELVVFVVKSPPLPGGADLLSGVADMHGFRHESVTTIPPETFERGKFGDTTGMDFAEADPNIVVRVGSTTGKGGREDSQGLGAYSRDNGRTWTAFANLPAGAANGKVAVAATLQPNGKPVIVWAPQGEVYPQRSLDGGQTWQAVTGAPNRTTLQLWFASQAIAADRVDGNLFYLYKYNERPHQGVLYRSQDAGATWKPAATGLPDFFQHAVKAMPGKRGEVWLRVQGYPLYRSVNAGDSFTPLAQVTDVTDFAFGHPAPHRQNPTVFVAGTVNGVQGVFRSDDATALPGKAAQAKWVKLSTPQQRLSNVTFVEGDRRVYGRVYLGTGGRGIFYGGL